MLKRSARLALIATVILSSALNADLNAEKLNTESVASDDSFSYQISKQLESTITVYCDTPTETDSCDSSCESFTRSSIAILAEQDGEDFDDLLVKTIKQLALEIDPEQAAQMYLACVKNTFDKAIAAINFDALASSQNEDEAKQALGSLFQDLFNAMTSKDAMLEQAIYFATFSDEIVKDITNTMAVNMQELCAKMGNLKDTSDSQTIATEFKKTFDEFLTSNLNATATVFENHGYEIDRQSLGL